MRFAARSLHGDRAGHGRSQRAAPRRGAHGFERLHRGDEGFGASWRIPWPGTTWRARSSLRRAARSEPEASVRCSQLRRHSASCFPHCLFPGGGAVPQNLRIHGIDRVAQRTDGFRIAPQRLAGAVLQLAANRQYGDDARAEAVRHAETILHHGHVQRGRCLPLIKTSLPDARNFARTSSSTMRSMRVPEFAARRLKSARSLSIFGSVAKAPTKPVNANALPGPR